jgi:hypothetical protein
LPFNGTPNFPGVAGASVHVCVEGVTFQYQLTEDDLTKVFSRYGAVRFVNVNPDGASAIVHFYVPIDAEKATRDLDGKVLNGVQGALRVTQIPTSNLIQPYPMDTSAVNGNRPVRKYTCRFEIGVENEREFHVARRIIGQKGANMKRIVMSTENGDSAKLRLRGKGSGFMEGPLKQESNEPLHLCISCKDYNTYRSVVEQVTKLLEDVYKEYADYCRASSIDRPIPRVTMREHPLLAHSLPQPQQQSQKFGVPPIWPGGLTFPSVPGSYSQFGSPPNQLYPPAWKEWLPPPPMRASPDPQLPTINNEQSAPIQDNASPPGVQQSPNQASSNEPAPVECTLSVPEIERLIDERNEARRVCNFKEADRIRDLLRSQGIGLMDEPGGRGRGTEVTTWRYWRK